MPGNLRSVRGEIHKLQKKLDDLMKVESKAVDRNKAKGGSRAMNREVKRIKEMQLHKVAKNPLIVCEGCNVRIRWSDYYMII